MASSKKAIIRNGRIIYGDDIEADVAVPNETAARERRQAMKTKNRGEMLQPNQTEYYKKYPEQLSNLSPDLRRLLS